MADADGDGLPDYWEIANGLNPNSGIGIDGASGDPDGDGENNAREFLAGTAANNTMDVFRVAFASVSGQSVRIGFRAPGCRRCSVWRAPSPLGPWVKIADAPVSANDTLVEIADALQPGPLFYRVTAAWAIY
jgi:hypothetical protein